MPLGYPLVVQNGGPGHFSLLTSDAIEGETKHLLINERKGEAGKIIWGGGGDECVCSAASNYIL